MFAMKIQKFSRKWGGGGIAGVGELMGDPCALDAEEGEAGL